VIFLARCVEIIGGVAVPVDTASVLANRRHLEAPYVARGTAARVHDMAVDIGVVGCRECRMSKLFGNRCRLVSRPRLRWTPSNFQPCIHHTLITRRSITYGTLQVRVF
jgi:hypothetical protein